MKMRKKQLFVCLTVIAVLAGLYFVIFYGIFGFFDAHIRGSVSLTVNGKPLALTGMKCECTSDEEDKHIVYDMHPKFDTEKEMKFAAWVDEKSVYRLTFRIPKEILTGVEFPGEELVYTLDLFQKADGRDTTKCDINIDLSKENGKWISAFHIKRKGRWGEGDQQTVKTDIGKTQSADLFFGP